MVSDRSRVSRCTSVASFYKIRIACFQIDICCLFFVFCPDQDSMLPGGLPLPFFSPGSDLSTCLMQFILSKIRILSMLDVGLKVSQWRGFTRLSRQPHERDQRGLES